MKNVLICSAFYEPHTGGVEQYVKKLAAQFAKNDIHVIIVTTNFDNDNNYSKTGNIEVYKLPVYSPAKNRYPLIKKNKEYHKIIKKIFLNKYDLCLINTRFYILNYNIAKLAYKYDIPCFLIEHGSNYLTLNNKVLDIGIRAVEKYMSKKIRPYITNTYGVSKAASEWSANFGFQTCGELYNCIDISDYDTYSKVKIQNKKINKDDIVLMFAGRLVPDKGIMLLVSAFIKLQAKYKNIKLVICGDGHLYKKISNIENNNIILTGKLTHEEIMPYYNRADIFINPSRSEGLPTSLLEAGLMKTAILATNVGGTYEIIDNKTNGYYIEYNEQSVYNGIKRLIDDKKQILSIKNNIQKHIINNFSSQSIANKILYEYDKLKEEKKITLITVCYNSEKTIENTLKSVLMQKYNNYEYIIIDGKSSDKTLEIVNKYKKLFKNKLIVVSEKDKGIYDAMNKGIAMASGEIIGLLNSDDCLHDEDVFSKVNNNINNSVDYIYSDLLINEDINLKIPKRIFKTNKGNYKFGWMPPHPTFYVKKDIYDNIGNYDINFKIAADYDFMIRIFKSKKYKGKYIKSVFVNMNPGGESTNGIKSHLKSVKDAYKVMIHNKMLFPICVSILKLGRTTIKAYKAKIFASKSI